MANIILLIEKTRDELDIDFDHGLSSNDHRTVWMKCCDCGENFLRPYRYLQIPHACQVGPNARRHTAHHPSLSMPRLECKLVHPLAKIPKRNRTTDAGYDVFSVEEIVIPGRGGPIEVNIGIKLAAPEGFYYTIDGRSNLWKKKVFPYRGIIDATYTGPLSVFMLNNSRKSYTVCVGHKIAQIILHRINDFDIAIVDEFSPDYVLRGDAGFGSTGE